MYSGNDETSAIPYENMAKATLQGLINLRVHTLITLVSPNHKKYENPIQISFLEHEHASIKIHSTPPLIRVYT